MATKRVKKEYSIQAVDNSFDVLEQFCGEKRELGITEISKNLGLHKNNVFRLLATLENRGYIEQDLNSGNYRLGTRILELNFAYMKHTTLIRVSKPILDELVSHINENAYLGLLRNNQVVYVEYSESTQVLRVSSRIGMRLSPLCSAIGKIILTYTSEEEKEQVIKVNKFIKHTAKTIISEEQFRQDIKDSQARGYALDIEEYDEGVSCVAAPVMDYSKRVVAGISVSGPTSRLTPETLRDKIIPKVLEAAKKLSRTIGYMD